MESQSKVKKENGGGEVLVRRGCAVLPPSATVRPLVAHLKMNNSISKSGEREQCDSGFGDDNELRSEEKQEELDTLDKTEELKCMTTLEETTRNLRIDSTDEADTALNRQPCSHITDKTENFPPVGGHFINYAESSDPRYLLAPLREQLFRQDEDGDTTLHLAVIHAQHQVVDAIVSVAPCRECLDIFNDLRQTPLHLAVITRQPSIVRSLLAAGASVDLRDRNGKTALHLACERGDTNCVQEITRPLLEKQSYSDDIRQNLKIMLEARDYQGFTALHTAVQTNSLQVVGHLAAIGADINCQDGTSGRSPLHHAIESCNFGMANFLIFQCKANVNSVTFDGCTPLHVAAGRGMESLAALLLAAGADPSLANYEGETPEDYAMEEVVALLES